MKLLSLVTGALLATASVTAPSVTSPSPSAIVGTWVTADKQGKVQIYAQQNRFSGKIIGVATNRPAAKNTHGGAHQSPAVGRVILQGFRYDGEGAWVDGTVYDPHTNKTYSCVIRMPQPNSLEVRGYVGFSLLGRTEVWSRVL
jgi:uncharacterized protein (DUF2147 family)